MSEVALVEPAQAIDVKQWSDVLIFASRFADAVSDTEFVPTALRGRPDAVAALVVYGAEIGVTPMQALSGIHIVDGRPAPSAELMRAMILRAGHSLTVHEMSGTRARVSGIRRGRPEGERVLVEWTSDMARAAGLLGRANWQRYPRAMLLARATGDLARLLFPDVVKGLGYVDESEPEGLDAWRPEWGAEPVPETPRRKPITRRRGAPEPARVSDAALPASEPATGQDEAPPVAPPREGIPVPHDTTGRRWSNEGDVEGDLARAEHREQPDEWLTDAERDRDEERFNEHLLDDEREPEHEPPSARQRVSLVDEPLPDEMQPVGTGRPILPELQPEQPAEEKAPATMGERPFKAMQAGLSRELGTSATSEDRHQMIEAIIGREIESSRDVNRAEGYRILDHLDRFRDGSLAWEYVDGGAAIRIYDTREPPNAE